MNRDEFIDSQYALLHEWSAQVDRLQEQMKAGTDATRAAAEKQLAELKKQQAAAEAQLAKMRTANEAALKDMQEGYQRIAQEYQETLKRAWSRFQP
ncbi:MAG TPA: hypothetical protein VFG43_16630 [Geminicoccaceae bacterium]|nr:hypothetical protein [Geminicoccaceae bacterium]